MQDPFELHPETPALSKKDKNILTLGQINAIIDIKIESVEKAPVSTWGFTREDIIETLETLREEIENKCQINQQTMQQE